MRCSVTFLKPWDSTTREYTAGANCKNWKPPLLSLTASNLAVVAWLVSVSLAPVIAAPLGSFTNPAMLPVGDAETVVAIRRIMSANAHMPNCSLRHELLDDLEIRFRSINTSTPSQVSFLPVPGGTSGNQIYGRTYCRSRCLSSPKGRLISKRFAGRRFEFFQSHRPKIVASCVPVESSAHPRRVHVVSLAIVPGSRSNRKLAPYRGSKAGQGPYVLRFFMAKQVAVAVLHEHAKVSRSRRIPAILYRHDLPGSIRQIQPQGTLVRFIPGIALHTDDLFTHGLAPFCGSRPAPRSRRRPGK